MLNMAVEVPIPIASVRIAVPVTHGSRLRRLNAYRKGAIMLAGAIMGALGRLALEADRRPWIVPASYRG
jgi:hypothetical protein